MTVILSSHITCRRHPTELRFYVTRETK